MRFYLIDKIVELKYFEYAIGIKNVALTEDYFNEHFPDYPVMPGSLQIEAMAQLGGALLELSHAKKLSYMPRCILSMIEKAKFRKIVSPGDSLNIRTNILSFKEDFARVNSKIMLNGECITESILVYIIKKVEGYDLERSRRQLLTIWTKDCKFL